MRHSCSCDYIARNSVERRMSALVERLWSSSADERPNIFEVGRALKEAKEHYDGSWHILGW